MGDKNITKVEPVEPQENEEFESNGIDLNSINQTNIEDFDKMEENTVNGEEIYDFEHDQKNENGENWKHTDNNDVNNNEDFIKEKKDVEKAVFSKPNNDEMKVRAKEEKQMLDKLIEMVQAKISLAKQTRQDENEPEN